MREERRKRRKRQQIITLVVCALVLAALVDYALLVASARGKNWQQEDREQMEYLRQYNRRKR